MQEVVAMYAIPQLQWVVSTHENTARLRSELDALRSQILVFAAGLGLILAILASYAARQVSSMYEQIIEGQNKQLQIERDKSDKLLLNIMPQDIAEELKENHTTLPRQYPSVSVLFADLVGFTDFSANLAPECLVAVLNRIFNDFDELSFKYGLEKIKTIGDCYMVCAGVPKANAKHAQQISNMALEMLTKMQEINHDLGLDLQLRIGIHSGETVAGVIGKAKFAYDMWGDTVNTASRMESTGIPGKIQISSATYQLLHDQGYLFEKRDEIDVKGKGKMKTFFLTSQLQPDDELRAFAAAVYRPEIRHSSLACKT
ncbi:adenylate/guanylate cyclase domain-containing protein [Candidatus Entotheonella palauensis]|uniref:Adenylate cyclase n=1 Tax=Candidatus Entotheonella gemina TaxID=1429439 RepID=W4M0S1_9BACT|nr:adenylate/guanylate cyclase domain-containing protein [Candidatus Entotheonella palauensis]ETX03262.1 MAG: hypothetical protein ETSY2_33860 [Candidatus Entotheonella gemina]